MRKIDENTKVTLTLGQIKRLVRECPNGRSLAGNEVNENDSGSSDEAIEKFKKACELVEGFVGVVQQGNEIAIATMQDDCGEDGTAVSLNPIRMFLSKFGLRGSVMPFPASNGKLIYVVRLRY